MAARLKAAVKSRRRPLKAVVNEALRAGLTALEHVLARGLRSGRRVRSRAEPRRQSRQHRGRSGAGRGGTTQVILVDANLLMYAANGAAPEHDRARSWLDDRLNGSRSSRTPVAVAAGVRPSSDQSGHRARSREYGRRLAAGRRMAWVRAGVDAAARAEHSAILGDAGVAGDDEPSRPRCAPGGARRRTRADPLSTDGDFARFPGLRWENPLAA